MSEHKCMCVRVPTYTRDRIFEGDIILLRGNIARPASAVAFKSGVPFDDMFLGIAEEEKHVGVSEKIMLSLGGVYFLDYVGAQPQHDQYVTLARRFDDHGKYFFGSTVQLATNNKRCIGKVVDSNIYRIGVQISSAFNLVPVPISKRGRNHE